jgi:hypothetical protein
MPFREKWSTYIYNDFIAKALQQCGLHAQRADEMFGRNVLQDIWRGIASARLVVADISVPNENVFYELGIAHTVGKPTILITQRIDRIPFDLRTERMIVYSDDHPGYQKLAAELPKHVNTILEEPINEVHRVISIMGGFYVEKATNRVVLDSTDPTSADIVDSMDIIGTRDNGVMVNKAIDGGNKVSHITCNHRHVSTILPDIVKMAALFDPPYLNTGDRKNVTFQYRVTGFFTQEKIWWYEVTAETSSLVFELVAPNGYQGRVKIVQVIKPVEYDVLTMTSHTTGNTLLFRGEIQNPKLNATYAVRWS